MRLAVLRQPQPVTGQPQNVVRVVGVGQRILQGVVLLLLLLHLSAEPCLLLLGGGEVTIDFHQLIGHHAQQDQQHQCAQQTAPAFFCVFLPCHSGLLSCALQMGDTPTDTVSL